MQALPDLLRVQTAGLYVSGAAVIEMEKAEFIKETASGKYFWVRCPICGNPHLMRKSVVERRTVFECAYAKYNFGGFYEPRYFEVELP